jgi:hypothetical protein
MGEARRPGEFIPAAHIVEEGNANLGTRATGLNRYTETIPEPMDLCLSMSNHEQSSNVLYR